MKAVRAGAVGAAAILSLLAVGGAPSHASAATVNLTLTVQSTQANPGSVVVSNGFGTTYATCAGPTAPGSATCVIPVQTESGLELDTQPAAGEAWKAWKGYCAGQPGPVCFVFQGSTARSVTVVLHKAGASPQLSTSQSVVFGNTPNCPSGITLSVTGPGFPANTADSLTDDGTVVATGTTDSSGNVSLSYGVSASEPGVFRTLSVTAGSVTATTDVGNALEFCLGGGAINNGTTSFVVGDSDNDANGSFTYQFGKNPAVVVQNDSSGAGQATTPSYSCPNGKSIEERISGSSETGTKWAYRYSVAFPFSCTPPATGAVRAAGLPG